MVGVGAVVEPAILVLNPVMRRSGEIILQDQADAQSFPPRSGLAGYRGEGHIDLERASRVSKSMDIRYRWRVDGAGKIEAVSDSATALCE